MGNPLNPRPFPRGPIVDKDGNPTPWFQRIFTDVLTRNDKILTNLGEIQSVAPILGRTEGISTTVGNIDAGGVVKAAGADFSRAYVNKNTDNITDATGSPLAGGKRGFVALDTNNRLANSFRGTAVNVSNTPTGATSLSNDGVSHVIAISGGTNQFAPSGVAYNAGTVDPGVFGTFYVFADDPTFAGGAVTYQFSTNPQDQTAAEGRVPFGKIITVGGTPKTGGGNSGGTTPGGGGGRGYSPA